ncbi:MAG: ABC transporter ATP-binding protein [Pikeienuella sp.]|uniref:ABC transporter ATP-binding protein n=1 Tax=Pikeienuella sp. TaxID=2831957 RepID=UPI00391CDBF7
MIRADGLTVSIGGAAALRGATFSIEAGERVGVVGESGSGKSMLAFALMGMAPEAARVTGSLLFDGREMACAAEADWAQLRARRAAMIFQEPLSALNPLRRIGDIVMEPLRVHLRLSRDAAEARARALFEEVGLPEDRFRQFPHEISGGQRQRVLIALALACDPGLLIADEPTTALDAHVALRVIDLLKRLSAERRMALLFISHDLAAVVRATERLIVMYGGDMVETGPTAEVLAAPAHPYTKGLLAARPRIEAAPRGADGRRARLATIPGTVPGLLSLPTGCRFSGRCPLERTGCAKSRPALRPTEAGAAACVLIGAEAEA